jgi:hypothetical protein
MSDKFEIGTYSNGTPAMVIVNDEAANLFEQAARTSSGKTYRELADEIVRSGRADEHEQE